MVAADSIKETPRYEVRPVLLLSAVWLAVVLIVDPRGEFALNDDWAYALMVRRFLETGHIDPSTWTYVPCISNVWIGAAAARLFGTSHVVLRCSTLFMAWVALLGIYALGRSLELKRWPSAGLALIYALAPVCVGIAFTFMTDSAFSAFLAWGMVGAVRGCRGRPAWFALAVVGTGLAVISRQPALALAIACVGAAVLRFANSGQRLTMLLVGSIVLGLGAVVLADALFPGQRFQVGTIVREALAESNVRVQVTKQVIRYVIALGLLFGPLIPLVAQFRGRQAKFTLAGALTLSLMVFAFILRYNLEVPCINVGSIVGFTGIGPQVVHGGMGSDQWLSAELRWTLTIVGTLAGSYLVALAIELLVQRGLFGVVLNPLITIPLLFVSIYLAAVLLRPGFDRYLVPIAPGILMLLPLARLEQASVQRWAAAGAWCVVGFTYGALGTVDYLNHNRARAALIQHAHQVLGAPITEIEGGFEFNGDQNYYRQTPQIHAEYVDKAEAHAADEPRYTLALRVQHYGDASNWSFFNDRYLVSMSSAVQGYRRIQTQEYARRLRGNTDRVHLYERE